MTRKLSNEDILFVGLGRSPVAWYRAALPAMYLGADWVGLDDNLQMVTGLLRNGRRSIDFDNYKIIIWQQPRSYPAQMAVKELRAAGKKVVIDCDDYLHGVRRMKDHDFRNEVAFSKKELEKFEKVMWMSDGLILSTPWLASKYRRHQMDGRVWVCRNGLDLGRYDITKPYHKGVNIGWSGATGHVNAFAKVLDALENVMNRHPETNFIAIGAPFSDALAQRGIDPIRLLSLPFTSVELYPNAMSMFDIALAPARDTGWYRAKSQLRYYEAAALGAPVIGDATLYDEIIDGQTGFKVHSDEDWEVYLERLVTDTALRMQMSVNAKHVAFTEFDMGNRVKQWLTVIDELAGEIIAEEHNADQRNQVGETA